MNKANVILWRLRSISILLVFVVGITTIAGCGGDSSTSAQAPSPNSNHNAVLEQLGVDVQLPTERTDLQGDPIDDNPLGATVAALKPACEIFWMNGGLQSGPVARIQEDGLASPSYGTAYDLKDDLAWTATPLKNTIAADIDGDGLDEIVIAYLVTNADYSRDLWVKTIDKEDDGSGVYREDRYPIAEELTVGTFEAQLTAPYLPTMARGDFDEDGRDEVIVGFMDLYLVKLPVSSDPLEVSTRPYDGFTVNGMAGLSGLFVAAGDLDGDGRDEIVAMEGPNCDILHWSSGGGFQPAFSFWDYRTIPSPPNNPVAYQDSVNVAVGDIDDDGTNEVVFHGRVEPFFGRYRELFVTAMRLTKARDGFEALDFYIHTYGEEVDGTPVYDGGSTPRTTLALLDYDGDGSLEIFARNWLWRYAENPGTYSGSGIFYGADDIFTVGHAERLHNFTVNENVPPYNLAVADVNGDHTDDLVYDWSDKAGTTVGVRAWVRNSISIPTEVEITGDTPVSSSTQYTRIAPANMDTDSTVVAYTGDHELLFSEPRILAVMACPPYHAGIGQTSDLTGTTIGKRVGQQIVEENSTSVTVGFSVGVELEDRVFTQSKFASELRYDLEAGLSRRSLSEQSVSIAYSSGVDEDKVIFTAFPFDVYYYQVLHAGRDSDLLENGTLTISVPRKPQIIPVSRTYYNANNGDYADIDETVLGHTIGDVYSYPGTPPSTTELLRSDTTVNVGQGTGYNTVTIDILSGTGTGNFKDFSVDVSIQVGTGGVYVGAQAGYAFGYSYDVMNTSATFYEGNVSNIPNGYSLSEYGYNWGICAYPFISGTQQFTVVNYWVTE